MDQQPRMLACVRNYNRIIDCFSDSKIFCHGYSSNIGLVSAGTQYKPNTIRFNFKPGFHTGFFVRGGRGHLGDLLKHFPT